MAENSRSPKNSSSQSQDKSMLRKQKYKELMDIASHIGNKAETDSVVETLLRISTIAKKSNEINEDGPLKERMENTSEAVMDAQVMKMSHEILGSALQKMDNSEFSDVAYYNIIMNLTSNGRHWTPLTDITASIAKTTRTSQSLYGTFEFKPAEAKVIKQRQARRKVEASQQQKPETVSQLQKEEKRAQKLNQAMKQINELYQKNKEPIPYYQLIVDPDDFMNTVENAFQISFLFRDGNLQFELDDDNMVVIIPVDKSKKDSKGDKTIQFVSDLSPTKCQEIIEQYNITAPLLSINREAISLTQS